MTTRKRGYVPAKESDRKFVGRLVKEARFARGLTPVEAAQIIGISRSAYYRLENGDLGVATVRIVKWLLGDKANAHDPVYWRERALLAERRLAEINATLVEYSKARRSFEDVDGYVPNSVSPREGTRFRVA